MKIENYIPVAQLSSHYEVEISFFDNLHEFSLIEIHLFDEIPYIDLSKINELEKIIRIHQELNINFEGIDVVLNLLEKIESLQIENEMLKNKIDLHE